MPRHVFDLPRPGASTAGVHPFSLPYAPSSLLSALCSMLLAPRSSLKALTFYRLRANWSNLYICFMVPPYSRNIARALTKEAKYYLFDWLPISK
jgi:hypothetical protein